MAYPCFECICNFQYTYPSDVSIAKAYQLLEQLCTEVGYPLIHPAPTALPTSPSPLPPPLLLLPWLWMTLWSMWLLCDGIQTQSSMLSKKWQLSQLLFLQCPLPRPLFHIQPLPRLGICCHMRPQFKAPSPYALSLLSHSPSPPGLNSLQA